MNREKGFSLVELIIVIAIMAVLVGVMAPQYIKYVEKSRISSDDSNAAELLKNVTTALANEDALADLDSSVTNADIAVLTATGIEYTTASSCSSLVKEIQDTMSTDDSVKIQSTRSKNSVYVISIDYLEGTGFKAAGRWTDASYSIS